MTNNTPQWLRLWFGFQLPVDQKTYLWTGLGLMAVRCLGDALILIAHGAELNGQLANPLMYLSPLMATRGDIILSLLPASNGEPGPRWPLYTMAVWALPFLWIGLSMSLRRARDAGLSTWIGLGFLIPILNLAAIACLCALPSRTKAIHDNDRPKQSLGLLRNAMESIALSALFGVLVMVLAVFVLGEYGLMLFVGGPVVMGTIAGWRINHPQYRGFASATAVGVLSCLMCAGMLVLFALEGIICIAMVAPLALVLTLGGAFFGSMLARNATGGNNAITAMALALPIMGGVDAAQDQPLPLYEMTSEIHVDASPSQVWPNVVGFSDLPPPQDWLLNTGIACPLRATIKGSGVGAIRYCEFTTGSFVEPITVWDPPHRLAFNVIEQPEPMHEWSPYDEVYAPHLQDTMMSQRGQFELIETENGTLLRGTTWYTLDIAPGGYWRLWTDFVVHRIHLRVLRHIKDLSEPAGA